MSTASVEMFTQVTVIEPQSIPVTNETFRIINLPNLPDLSLYQNAMEEANFDSYRFIDKRRNLTFESGVVIELFSVNEVQALGIVIDETKATSIELPQGYTPPTYKITPDGKIVAVHILNPRKK
jgi:hypothetical protein